MGRKGWIERQIQMVKADVSAWSDEKTAAMKFAGGELKIPSGKDVDRLREAKPQRELDE